MLESVFYTEGRPEWPHSRCGEAASLLFLLFRTLRSRRFLLNFENISCPEVADPPIGGIHILQLFLGPLLLT